MITLAQITQLLGWASIINIAYLLLATIILVLFKKPVASMHAKLFSLNEQQLNESYFNFLANYKIATLILAVAPYLALKAMGQ